MTSQRMENATSTPFQTGSLSPAVSWHFRYVSHQPSLQRDYIGFLSLSATRCATYVKNKNSSVWLQKGSPYLNDTNELIQLAVEMGLIEYNLNRAVPNSTKCSTWTDIQASHKPENSTLAVKFEDVYGVVVLLAIGFGTASLLVVVERLTWTLIAILSRPATPLFVTF